MKRVAIVGCSGSGKSTFAKKLMEKTGLPLYHMDKIFWKPNWIKADKQEFEEKLQQLTDKECWIIDGNYTRTAPQRFHAADTVFFFDLPVWLCLFRVLKRACTTFGQTRPDMADGCHEHFDLNFILYVARFQRETRPRILKALAENAPHCQIFIFKNRKDIESWLKNHAPH